MTEQLLTVTTTSHPAGPHVLRVSGELDHHTTERLREALDAVPASFATGIVLDLTDLTYCDSTGITELITAHQRTRAAGHSFDLVGLNPDLMHVFRIIGLDQVFSFHPTVDQAVRAARS
ncbi:MULTISPECIES: STAS domain-containing protein [Saccharothrix]|uniref:Anti-sigma factor antagonist n=2 Tax=Saccharothrix TaxID=2071 RepID=A0ABU0X883_9PSEU|nr:MULTISPECIES: STAS domain-containing protein [Saccharothrix]MDQ2588335.1 anti-anti-sigma factor [Saccharothrix yanglingensis]MDR6594062.1 anti-sigma B factor antagonist [Saccharothrix longispora]